MPIDMPRTPNRTTGASAGPGEDSWGLLAHPPTWAVLVLCCVAFDAVTAGLVRGQRFEAYSPHPTGLEITNGVSGVVCLEDEEPSHVCREAYTIPIVGEVMCEWSEDVDYPCTWYGYQFDVRNVETDTVIVCDVTNSIRTIFSPKTESVTGSNTAQYTIELEA
ncbi:MAG: hypothetical protein R3324_20065, partial [Halobacteriales archaeon]|nr:hypothetical protein [Halobacteriales archaeon]